MNQTIKTRIEKINNGEVPEGYEKTEIGLVPKDWKLHTLADIFDFKNGLNKEKEAFGKGTPIVNYTDVWKKRGIKHNDILGKVTLSSKEIQNYSAQMGDVFFTRTSETINEIGMSTVLLEPIEKCVFSGFVLRARPKNDIIIKEYNQYCYSTDYMRNEIICKSSITTRALTNGNFLGQVKINLPQKKEQEKIAEILMKWDEMVEAQDSYIKALELRKKALMQKLLTPKDGWKEYRVKELFKITRGQVLETNKCNNSFPYPVYSSQTFNNGLMGFYNNYLYENAITWTTDGANAGVVRYRNGKFFCTNVCGVLLSEKGYANECVANIINSISKYYVSYVGNPKLMNNTMGAIKITVPNSLNEQQRIADILSTADEEILLQKQKLAEIKQQRKSLQQLLLTGIVRVNYA